MSRPGVHRHWALREESTCSYFLSPVWAKENSTQQRNEYGVGSGDGAHVKWKGKEMWERAPETPRGLTEDSGARLQATLVPFRTHVFQRSPSLHIKMKSVMLEIWDR